MNTISLVIGDWSHDGHGHTDFVNIESNLSKAEVEDAYKAGTKKLGFNFVERVCSEYCENKMSNEIWQNFLAAGYTVNPEIEYYFEEEEEDGDKELNVESFADLYLFIVKLGNPIFDARVLPQEEEPNIKIGGYGLFD